MDYNNLYVIDFDINKKLSIKEINKNKIKFNRQYSSF